MLFSHSRVFTISHGGIITINHDEENYFLIKSWYLLSINFPRNYSLIKVHLLAQLATISSKIKIIDVVLPDGKIKISFRAVIFSIINFNIVDPRMTCAH